MKKNQKRLTTAFLAGAIAWTALCYALPCFQGILAGCLFGLAAFGILIGLLWRFTTSEDEHIVMRGARPLAGWQYLIVNLLWTGVAAGAAYNGHRIPVPLFVAVHLCLLAWLIWKLLAMGAGAEKIARVRHFTEEQTREWHSLVLRMEQLKDDCDKNAPQELQRLFEAIRYADPMEHEELSPLTNELEVLIDELAARFSEKNGQEISVLVEKSLRLIKRRNALCKSLKK